MILLHSFTGIFFAHIENYPFMHFLCVLNKRLVKRSIKIAECENRVTNLVLRRMILYPEVVASLIN